MPGFDGTGPMGQGPMTGMGMGPCGRGLRRGFRGGPGYGRLAPLSKDEEKTILAAQLKELDAERQEIAKKLQELA